MATPENSNPGRDVLPEPSGESGRVVSIPGEQRNGAPPGFIPSTRPSGPGSRGPYKPRTPKAEAPARGRQDDPEIDPAIIGDLFVSLAEISDDMFVLAIMAKAKRKLTAEIYPKFREEMERIRLVEKDKKMIHSGAVALAKKYTFLLKWGPEVILIVWAVQYTARMGNAFRRINGLPDLAPEKKPEVNGAAA
jgi:hypothetical protein